jgi:thiol-disulfide isomerase/thioredoxin
MKKAKALHPMVVRKPRPVRVSFLVAAVLVVLGAGLLSEPIRQWIATRAILANDTPRLETLEEFIANAQDPARTIRVLWDTGKIPHRQVAIRRLVIAENVPSPLPAALESMLVAGALDPDMNVRETALSGLRNHGHPARLALAAAQLADVDPELRLLGLRHFKAADPQPGLPLVIPLLDDPDPRVVGTALKWIERWTGESFDVSLADTVKVHNPRTGEREFQPEQLARIRKGIDQARTWWSEAESDYARVPLQVPAHSWASRPAIPAADFRLPALDGRMVRLSDYRGKVVFLNFWATGCTACLSELPALIALHERHSDWLTILGISLDGVPDSHGQVGGHDAGDEGHAHDHAGHDHGHAHGRENRRPSLDAIRAKVARSVERHGLPYPILLDPTYLVGGRFNGGELPTNVIIDADGHVQRRFVGARDLAVFDAMVTDAAGPGRLPQAQMEHCESIIASAWSMSPLPVSLSPCIPAALRIAARGEGRVRGALREVAGNRVTPPSL